MNVLLKVQLSVQNSKFYTATQARLYKQTIIVLLPPNWSLDTPKSIIKILYDTKGSLMMAK